MAEGNGLGFWIILIGASVVFLYLPQMMSRNRRKKQEQELQVGDHVMTIGGFIGDLVYINLEKNLARIRLAEGIVVEILPGAISGKRAEEPEEDATETESEAENTEG